MYECHPATLETRSTLKSSGTWCELHKPAKNVGQGDDISFEPQARANDSKHVLSFAPGKLPVTLCTKPISPTSVHDVHRVGSRTIS